MPLRDLEGTIGFSPVVIDSQASLLVGVGLAPLAVAPRHQRKGIGGKLIEEGLRRLRSAGHRWCVVLGHADYYLRYGFVLARTHGIRWEKPVPDNIFSVQALTPDGLDGVSGTARYRMVLRLTCLFIPTSAKRESAQALMCHVIGSFGGKKSLRLRAPVQLM